MQCKDSISPNGAVSGTAFILRFHRTLTPVQSTKLAISGRKLKDLKKGHALLMVKVIPTFTNTTNTLGLLIHSFMVCIQFVNMILFPFSPV